MIKFHYRLQCKLVRSNRLLSSLGYIYPKRDSSIAGCTIPFDEQQMVTIQFAWNGCLKPCSSSLIGTSPEFEVALYTLCFFSGGDKDVVRWVPTIFHMDACSC
jgi:poly(U)-specific endoribonuclease